jgi:hypothetical protein
MSDGSSEEREFSLDVPESNPRFDYRRIGAGVVAGLAIVAIGVFSVTDLSQVLLPMDDRYLAVLVPETEDGTEPFVLNELSNELNGNSLAVSGRLTNNSIEAVEYVVAVISVVETTGRFPASVEVPVDPPLLEPGESGAFSMSVTLPQKPNSYSVRFKLQNGPFVPHRDERVSQFAPANSDVETIRLNLN